MALERIEATVRVRNKPEKQPARVEPTQCGLNVFVQREVLADCPLLIDLARTRLEAGATTTHFFDDPTPEANEALRPISGIVVDLQLL